MASFTNAYTSMSGIDITATFDNVPIGTLQGISYSVTREKSPVYTFGSANPRSFSRGKRGLAGSMIFTLFDRSAMYNIVHDQNHYYYAHAHEPLNIFDPRMAQDVFSLYKQFESVQLDPATGQVAGATAGQTAAQLAAGGGAGVNPTGAQGNSPRASVPGSANFGVSTVQVPAEYSDQIMPFDITLIAQNEYGLAAFMVIIGVEILNEGGGLSVDDITNEEQSTFVARGKTPWIPWEGTNATQGDGGRTQGATTVFPFSEIVGSGAAASFYSGTGIPGINNATPSA